MKNKGSAHRLGLVVQLSWRVAPSWHFRLYINQGLWLTSCHASWFKFMNKNKCPGFHSDVRNKRASPGGELQNLHCVMVIGEHVPSNHNSLVHYERWTQFHGTLPLRVAILGISQTIVHVARKKRKSRNAYFKKKSMFTSFIMITIVTNMTMIMREFFLEKNRQETGPFSAKKRAKIEFF